MNSREVCHLWANPGTRRKDHARAGNVRFQGDTLYSYATPIARIYDERIALISERSYSVTTAKHISYAYRALPGTFACAVPFYMLGDYGGGQYRGTNSKRAAHAANVAHLAQRLAEVHARAGRVLTRQRVEWAQEEAERAHKALADYLIAFKLRNKMPPMPSFAAALERAERIEHPDPASLDKRERAAALRKEKNRERDEYLAEQRRSIQDAKRKRDFWRIGAARSSFRLGDAFGHDFEALRSSSCMLRVKGEHIETSYDARVPLAAAPMVWNLVQRAQGAGGFEPSRALGRVHIGDYPLDRIDADGTLHAGCHVIPYSELALMARALGLEAASA